MVSKGSDRVVLWPRYFDQSLSRAQGRRVPQAQAVRQPDAKWVASAAKKAGFDVVLEEGARDPIKPWKTAGRCLVPKKGSKEQVIQAVAAQMASSGSG